MHTNVTHESTNTAVVLFHHDTHSTLTQTLRYVTLLPTAFQKFTSSSHSICFPVDFTRAHTHTHTPCRCARRSAALQRSGCNYRWITAKWPGFGEVTRDMFTQLICLILCLVEVKTLCHLHGDNQQSPNTR